MQNEMPVSAIISRIASVFDLFRNRGISSSEYYVVLFLLSAYKDGLITDDVLSERSNLKESLIRGISEANDKNLKQYLEILPSFDHILNYFDRNGLINVLHTLTGIDRKSLTENFPYIFDSVLYKIAESQGRYGGEFIQPIELTRLICKLADLPVNSKVFNPFAGLASFGVLIKQGQFYFGQEFNRSTWALGTLRLMAYNRIEASNYVCEDSISKWPDPSEKFDLIVSNPPYGVRLNTRHGEIEPWFRTIEQFLLEKGVQSLNSKGKLIALLPQGFLFRGMHDQWLRKSLVEGDLIDTVISLPGGLLSNTGIPLAILIINRNKRLAGKVRFVEAKKSFVVKGPREKVLTDYHIDSIVHAGYHDSEAVRIISNEKVREFDYNLSVPRYFQKHIEGRKLGDILEFVRGKRGNLPLSGKLVRIKDLKDDNVDFKLNVSNIEESKLNRPGLHLIAESCLLLAIRWKTLKPTFFEFKGEPIFRNQDILSFKVDEKIADKAYLINELHADYVQEQLESYRVGATIPTIRQEDLLKVVIKLPSLAEQRAKVEGIFELSSKITSLQKERNALAHGVGNKVYESFSTVKHSLGKPLLNIGSSLRNIERALSKVDGEWEKVKLSDRHEITLKDSFDSIYSNLNFIHSVLKNNETELDVTKYSIEEIDFLGFIKAYVKKVKAAEKFNVKTNLDIHPDIKLQLDNKVFIKSNTELLDIALNAIVENADMHAFVDNTKKYKLEFRLGLYVAPSIKENPDDTIGRFNTFIKVEVANSGKPFPENYTFEKFVRKNSFAGETGNTGQGGFDLNEIIKYHNDGKSTLGLITDDFTTEFTTTYLFLIPLSN